MPLIGITGGLATGKSAVAALLGKRGAFVLSADDAARAVLAPGTPALREVVLAFGPDILLPNGALDRARLGAIIFADPKARHRLEAITHPPILRLLQRQIAGERQRTGENAVVAVEVPLLFEAGMQDWFDTVVVVAASEETEIARLQARDGVTAEEARRRIAAQMPLAEKIARADEVLWNDGDLAALEAQVEALWQKTGAER